MVFLLPSPKLCSRLPFGQALRISWRSLQAAWVHCRREGLPPGPPALCAMAILRQGGRLTSEVCHRRVYANACKDLDSILEDHLAETWGPTAEGVDMAAWEPFVMKFTHQVKERNSGNTTAVLESVTEFENSKYVCALTGRGLRRCTAENQKMS